MMVNKRKAIPKNIRMTVYQKCSGHCAYCGCSLEYKDINQERIFLKSRGLIPDSWLIIYENKSELVVVSRRRSYRKVLKKPRKNR